MNKFISDLQLAERYGVTRQTIWRWSRQGNLPKPVRIGPNCVRWQAAAIDRRDAELLKGVAQ